jgi:hypothetical protein
VNQCFGTAKVRSRSINSSSLSFLYGLKTLLAFSYALKTFLYGLSKPFGEFGTGGWDFCKPKAGSTMNEISTRRAKIPYDASRKFDGYVTRPGTGNLALERHHNIRHHPIIR